MGTTLTGTTPQDTYDSLIKVTDNGPLSGTAKYLSDGLGNDSKLALSTSKVFVNTTTSHGTLTIEQPVSESGLVVNSSTASAPTLYLRDAGGAGYSELLANNKLYINSGNVGIGTTNPNALRPDAAGSVARAFEVSGNGSAGIRLTDSSAVNRYLDISVDDNIAEIGAYYSTTQTLNLNAYGSINFKRQNTTIATITSSGLTFNGDTAAANALDDYEEGTWTPTLTFGGGSTGIGYNFQGGRYVKIGRQVFITGSLNISNKGSSTGAAVIAGLPFTVFNDVSAYSAPSLRFNGVSFTGQYSGFVSLNSTNLNLNQTTEAGTISDITHANFNNSGSDVIIFELSYPVS